MAKDYKLCDHDKTVYCPLCDPDAIWDVDATYCGNCDERYYNPKDETGFCSKECLVQFNL